MPSRPHGSVPPRAAAAPRESVRPPSPLRVMVSSTVLDLPEHRKAVIDAVIRVGCLPLAMEHGSAESGSDAIRFSLERVDQADVYVGVFGFRYGYVPDSRGKNPQGWSVTEHEYRRALERDEDNQKNPPPPSAAPS
jgi:hypothetical protein